MDLPDFSKLESQADIVAAISTLRDRMVIIEVVTTTVTHADLGEYDLLAKRYADEITFDYSAAFGGTPKKVSNDALMEYWTRLGRAFEGTHFHMVTNVLVEHQDAHRARTRSYVCGSHWSGPRFTVSGGIYYHDLERQPDGRWLITGLKYTPSWRSGDPTVMTDALAKAGADPSR